MQFLKKAAWLIRKQHELPHRHLYIELMPKGKSTGVSSHIRVASSGSRPFQTEFGRLRIASEQFFKAHTHIKSRNGLLLGLHHGVGYECKPLLVQAWMGPNLPRRHELAQIHRVLPFGFAGSHGVCCSFIIETLPGVSVRPSKHAHSRTCFLNRVMSHVSRSRAPNLTD